MPLPDGFDTIIGHFEPTGQCIHVGGCPRLGWNMTGGLCSECFRVDILDSKQREVGDLWDIYEMIVVKEMPRASKPGPTIDEEW